MLQKKEYDKITVNQMVVMADNYRPVLVTKFVAMSFTVNLPDRFQQRFYALNIKILDVNDQ